MSEFAEPRILILGAGPSGIGAARTFFQNGMDPIILEARDRIGGRMYQQYLSRNLESSKMDKSDSQVTIQLGANWIHGLGDFNPMYVKAKELCLGLYKTSPDDEPGDDVLLFDKFSECANHSPVDHKDYEAMRTRYSWIRERLCSFRRDLSNDCDELDHGKRILSLAQAFDCGISASEREFGPCSALHRRCLYWIFDRISISLADSMDNISAQQYAGIESDGAYGEALVSGGYYQILEHLATEFPLNIMLEHVVTRVHTDPVSQAVSVHCSNGSVFEADVCLITVPVGVLTRNAIEFTPRVPRCISSICSTVKVGLMNLVWMLFPHQFWPDGFNFFGVARDAQSSAVEFSTFLAPPVCDQHGKRQPVLMCQVVGAMALEIEELSDREVAARAVAVLRRMFSSVEVPDAVGCRHSAWSKDCFSGGSWCHVISDTEAADLVLDAAKSKDDSYLQPVSKSSDSQVKFNDSFSSQWSDQTPIFYSSEATHEVYRGTVHGAFLAGIREASHIVSNFCRNADEPYS